MDADRSVAMDLARAVVAVLDGTSPHLVSDKLIQIVRALGANVETKGNGLFRVIAAARPDDLASELCRFVRALYGNGVAVVLSRRQLRELRGAHEWLGSIINAAEEVATTAPRGGGE